MSKKATVTIVLEYSADDLRFMRGEDFPDSGFEDVVKEQAYLDLRNYMLSDPIEYWSEIVIEDE